MSGSGVEDVVKTYKASDCVIIPEGGSLSSSMEELALALEEEKPVVVIQDKKLATRTALWMNMVRFVDGMSLATALGSIACSLEPVEGVGVAGKPLAVCSILVHLGYQACWVGSDLSHYRVAQGPDLISLIKGQSPPTTILEREGEATCKRRYFYGLMSAVAVGMAFWRDFHFGMTNVHEWYDKIKSMCEDEVLKEE